MTHMTISHVFMSELRGAMDDEAFMLLITGAVFQLQAQRFKTRLVGS